MRLTLYEASTRETRPEQGIGNSGLLRGEGRGLRNENMKEIAATI